MNPKLLLDGLLALLAAALLASCGGGGGGGAGALVGVGGRVASGTGIVAADNTGGSSSGGSTGGASGDTASTSDGTTAAAGGDDGSGVGSGGTGVSSADATGIGSADGLGSIFVDGLRYDTDSATLRVEDAASLQLGMTVKVTGPIGADFATGTARLVESGAELRGPLSSIDIAAGSFVVQGSTVTTDEATVWADASGLAAIGAGTPVQVWGLPAAPGVLRATRVERTSAAAPPIVTGVVQGLNLGLGSFNVGGLRIDFLSALLAGAVDPGVLADGAIVRVRGSGGLLSLPGVLTASLVQAWNPLPPATGQRVQLAGVITDFATLSGFRVLGTRIDASLASISGGPASAVGNGVKVVVDGVYANGIVAASKLKIRHLPGSGAAAAFKLIGPIEIFSSPSSFRVRGQLVNAGGAGVLFVNGTPANLANGSRVNLSGSRVANGVLLAERVSFE